MNFAWPITLKDKQEVFNNFASRYTIGVVGRQFGKSMSLIHRLFVRRIHRQGISWSVSPTFAQARILYRRSKDLFAPIIKSHSDTRLELLLINGSWIHYKSADAPDNLRGETLHDLAIDEAAMMKHNIWSEILKPMVAVHKGSVDFFSTPKGMNWFYDLYTSALGNPDLWQVIKLKSCDSPFFSLEEYEENKRITPQRIFSQEYDAEFITDDSGVFRNINNCVVIDGVIKKEYDQSCTYTMGVDLARTHDWTVLIVMDNYGNVVHFDRFNDVSWELQEKRIVDVARKWRAQVNIDSTGVGDPITARIMQHNINVNGVKFNASSKTNLINNLSMCIENKLIRFEEIPELIAELRMYEAEQTGTGHVRYNAPSGYHDDCVIALALAAKDIQYDYSAEQAFADTELFMPAYR